MAYSTGMMKHRVQVAKRATDESTTFGKSGQPKYEILGTFWMCETFNKGVKSMREGALDAYDTVMFRCRFNKDIDRWCLLKFHGKWYQITSFNEDYQDNQIQITAVELANQQVNIVPPTIAEIWGNEQLTQRPSGHPTQLFVQFKSEISQTVTLTNSSFTMTITFDEQQNRTTVALQRYILQVEGTEPIAKNTTLTLTFSPPVPGAQPPLFNPDSNYTFK